MKDIIEEFEKLGYRICKNDDEISFMKENEIYKNDVFFIFYKKTGEYEKYLSKGITEKITFEEYKLISKIYYRLGFLSELPY